MNAIAARRHRLPRDVALCVAACLAAGAAHACDGKSHAFNIAVGEVVEAGGLAVQLNKVKLLDSVPDKYIISVKDDDTVLGDHVLLEQYEAISFKTRCGTVSIGGDLKSMFSHGNIAVNWSYF